MSNPNLVGAACGEHSIIWRVRRRRKPCQPAFSKAATFPYSSSAGPMGRMPVNCGSL
jgi:hypothetical protein